ncbi:MAG: amidohydrolase [Thiolinea sp.]
MRQWFDDRRDELEGWLHTIHRQPETGFDENHTARFVAERLQAAGIEVHTGIGKTGVVGVLQGTGGQGRTIGFRAELDALPMQECSGVHYHSQVDGKFHGCGHDGHTVTLLSAASYLAEHRDFCGTAIFVFQPAEELLTGAQAMLEDGFLQRFPCDEIYAMHNLPGLGAGQIGVPSAGALASADHVVVEMQAQGTHGSAPHTGQDAILASAHFLTSLQQSLSRLLDSRDSGVISFGSIHAGNAFNILPEQLKMEGTIRTHSETVRNIIKQQLDKVARSTESLYGVTVSLSYPVESPVTQNHPLQMQAVLEVAAQVAGADNVQANCRPLMASEDFAYFLQEIPGAYFFMGQDGPYCHHPEFVFDTRIIPLGASLIAELIRQRTLPDTHV